MVLNSALSSQLCGNGIGLFEVSSFVEDTRIGGSAYYPMALPRRKHLYDDWLSRQSQT